LSVSAEASVERNLGLVSDDESGGTHTSRTIMLRELRLLLASCQSDAEPEDYVAAIVEENVLGKKSENTRARSLRYLRELYVLDRRSVLFRGLRDLWDADEAAQPLLALMCSLARDPLLRATAGPVLDIPLGGQVDAGMLSAAVAERYPDSYSEAVRNKVGRNASSSWTQSGHLHGRSTKTRTQAVCRPAAVAFASMIGYLTDARGQGLLRTVWGRALDAPDHVVFEHAFAAAQRGWIEFRRAGEIIDVGFGWLLRPVEE
jgi:hypothetical protein